MYICVDFDGTVVKHEYPKVGAPLPSAIHYLRRFQGLGAKIILWTMRSGNELTEAVEYLEKHGVKLFGVNENPTQHKWTTSPKAYGHVYIDDAAFGCPLIHPNGENRPYVDWEKVGPPLLDQLLLHADKAI